MRSDIAAAREKYFAAKPFDPHKNAVPAVDGDGMPAGFMTMPDLGELQIIGCKLGMEYLAICHDEEAVEKWINTAAMITKSPELLGILFANVFRGVNIVIGEIISNAGLRRKMTDLAVEAWDIDFDKKFGGS
ncbi:hypothetical protein DEADP_53 [Mycobacterium phage DeadP]|uniref:Uncharacterized protein n=1 Tax=Mycobacterium phage DeadP TaxID=2922999 RepID=G8I4X6_9CAUD|nr:hypothetical protein CM05_gp053 [Mycobacterium phage DeadP]AER47796.1 hypothetical protein DEADP_53 [Mycobacterium phage DeadP]